MDALTSCETKSSLSELVDLKTRGRLIHPNVNFFHSICFVEKAFSMHCHDTHVFDLTVDYVLTNYDFKFSCIDHASDILSYAIYYYIRMRMRQLTFQENQKQAKEYTIKNKLSKLTTSWPVLWKLVHSKL